MSYTPTLIIEYNDLEKIKTELEEEQYSPNSDTEKVALFLLEELKFKELIPVFKNMKLIICTPEFTEFNLLVRDRLDEGDVYYTTFI